MTKSRSRSTFNFICSLYGQYDYWALLIRTVASHRKFSTISHRTSFFRGCLLFNFFYFYFYM